MKNAEVVILGCGNSTGVPAIGNYWGTCDPAEPRNNRTRSSIAVRTSETTIIVDTGPDFRTQLTRENIFHVDGVLYTHAHADHVNGIDELRVIRFRNKALVPVYANLEALQDLQAYFPYIFNGGKIDLYPPLVEAHVLDSAHFGVTRHLGEINFIPFEQNHGSCTSVGYRFGNLAYSLDFLTLDQAAIEILKGVKTWIVDAAAYNQSNNAVHANLETIYRLNEQIGAEQVYLSSLSLAMDYQTLCKELPQGYAPAYDGLKLEAVL